MPGEQDKFLAGVNQKKSDAWKELYRFFYGALCNYAHGIIGDEGEEEDIVQECLVAVWKSGIFFQEMRALSTYLYRAVYHNSLKYLRDKQVRQGRLKQLQIEADEVEDCDFYDAVEEDVVRNLRMVMAELPEQRQRILLLSLEGLTIQQIATQLGISINTVKTQKKRAYALLKERLKQDYLLLFIFFPVAVTHPGRFRI